MNCPDRPYCTFALTVIAAAWFLVALFIGETELLQFLPAPAIPVTVWSLVGILLVAFWKNRAFRSFVDQLGMRTLIALHLPRFIGFYLLYLSSRGELPAHFAIPAGWGDIGVAVGALVLLLRPTPKRILLWNTIGILEILFVVFTVGAQVLSNHESMNAFTALPLSFLPTFIVPLIITSHVVIFLRLRNPGAERLPAGGALDRA